MNAIMSFILKYVLDFAFGKIQTYFKRAQKKEETKTEINKKVSRLKKAVREAYDGNEVTPEQKKELVDAARIVISSY